MRRITLNVSLLIYYVGVAVLPGILILIALVPLNRMLMRMQMKLRFAGQRKSDERIKLINEVLKGIRVVKTYAWEDFLFDRIDELRGSEIAMIRTRAYVRACASVCLVSTSTSIGLRIASRRTTAARALVRRFSPPLTIESPTTHYCLTPWQ